MKVNFRKLRKSLNLTQTEFAERIDCGQTNVSFLEKGLRNTPKEMYERLVEAFGKDAVDACIEPDIPRGLDKVCANESGSDAKLISMLVEQQRQTAELIAMQKKLVDLILSHFPDLR